MKTLNQTIEALSAFYSGLEIPEGEEPLLQCAFHYLKEYRDHLAYTEKVREEFEEARDKHLEALKDIYEERKKLIGEIRAYQGKINELMSFLDHTGHGYDARPDDLIKCPLYRMKVNHDGE